MGAAAGTAQQARPRRTAVPAGVYRPRRPRASPLYRLIEDHFQEFTTIYYHRTLLGDLSRVAARTITAFIRATLGERDLSVGIVSSIQTHGSLANWHSHLHMLVTDGGFHRPPSSVAAALRSVL